MFPFIAWNLKLAGRYDMIWLLKFELAVWLVLNVYDRIALQTFGNDVFRVLGLGL
uniref:Uncharacterized protein n=1 Tax=Rhizophora mucronata TaxID=61149 RepID=A0A2P2NCV2_RHIMU